MVNTPTIGIDPAFPGKQATDAGPASLIVIRGLETQFRGKKIHSGLDLEIMAGEVLVLLGGSGSGKSTLLRTLVGLEKPSGGSCMFGDIDLFQLGEPEWIPVRRRIAYVFQGGALFDSLTVGDNLRYPLEAHTKLAPHEREEKISRTLTELGLPGIEGLLPSALSGGMQKRVGLARALMLDPDVILYDEPTAGLDPANSRMIGDTIRALQATGKTSVLVTHDTPCALAVADRLALIGDCRIATLQSRKEYGHRPDPQLESFIQGDS